MECEDKSIGITVFKNIGVAVDNQLNVDQLRFLENYCDFEDYRIRDILDWNQNKKKNGINDVITAAEILQKNLFKEWGSMNNDHMQATVKSIFEKRSIHYHEIPYDMLKETVQVIGKASRSGMNAEDFISNLEKESGLDYISWLRKNRTFDHPYKMHRPR